MKFELKVAMHGMVQTLELEAGNADQARLMAEARGASVLVIHAMKQVQGFSLTTFTKKKSFHLTLFSQELLALLESGLSLIEAIEALAEKEQQPEAALVFKTLVEALYEGLALSAAMEQQPDVFPALYVALIRSSERTGDMVQALSRHVAYQSQIDAVKKKIVTASIYPVLLIVVGGFVMLFLLGYVVPKFSTIYESAGTQLPWMSQMLLAWGRFVQKNSQEALLGFVAVMATIIGLLMQAKVRGMIVDAIWKIPAMGETLRVYQLARFYRTLGMLQQGGIPLVTGMQMVSSLLQPNLRLSLQQVEADVREGKPLSASMQLHGMTTSIAIRMLRVGERTGRMGEMMERIGTFYDEEIARQVDWLTRTLEPVLMIFIGMVVGVVVVLMYMPIFDLAGSVQ